APAPRGRWRRRTARTRRGRGAPAGRPAGRLLQPRQQRDVDHVLLGLAADRLDRAVDVVEAETVRRQQLERETLRRELCDRELDRAVAVAARALDRDRLLRQLLQREARERFDLALHEQRPSAPLQ